MRGRPLEREFACGNEQVWASGYLWLAPSRSRIAANRCYRKSALQLPRIRVSSSETRMHRLNLSIDAAHLFSGVPREKDDRAGDKRSDWDLISCVGGHLHNLNERDTDFNMKPPTRSALTDGHSETHPPGMLILSLLGIHERIRASGTGAGSAIFQKPIERFGKCESADSELRRQYVIAVTN